MLDGVRVRAAFFAAPRMSLATQAVSVLLVVAGCTGDGDGGGTIRFSAGPTSLAFAAAQDGDGPWTVVMPSDNGTYELSVTGPTYGIAVVCGDDSFKNVTIVQAAVAETSSPSLECNYIAGSDGSVGGTFSGTSAGQGVSVHVAYHEIATTSGSYTASMLPTGEWDIFALRRIGAFTPTDTDRIVRKNAVTIPPTGPVVVDFDFATEGFDVETNIVAIQGEQPGDRTDVRTSLRNMPGGTLLEMGPLTLGRVLTLPRSALRGDDIHAVTVQSTAPDGSSRQVRRWLLAGEDFTAMLPALPSSPVIESASSGSQLLMRGTVPSGLDVDQHQFTYVQRARMTPVAWSAILTRGYVDAGHPSYTLPDLTGLAGFDPTLGFVPGTSVDWVFAATSSDRGVGELLTAYPSASKLDGHEDAITTRRGRFPE